MIPAPVLGHYLVLEALLVRIPAYTLRPWMILNFTFFAGPFRWTWPAFFVSQALLLLAARKTLKPEIHGLWFLGLVLTALGVLCPSGRDFTFARDLAPAWTSLAGMVPLFLTMLAINLAAPRIWPKPAFTMRGEVSPLAPAAPGASSAPPLSGGFHPPQRPPAPVPAAAGFRKKIFLFILPLVLSGVMGLWFLVTLFLPGNPAPLPRYIPLLNPLDLEEAFCVVLFLLWQSALFRQGDLPALKKPGLFAITDTAVFLFLIAVTGRSVHFYGGVPYYRLFTSDAFQLCLFILWAVYGIAHIIGGHKRSLRQVWIAGAVLMVVDIAKLLLLDMAESGIVPRIVSFFIAGVLLLFIGWAAPLPPAAGKAPAPDTGEPHGD
jgi:hypothetical protein